VDLQSRAIERLADWAASAEAAYQVATRLVQTAFVPDAFKGKPHQATAAILAGLEVGLQPMASLRTFDVIGGQAAPRALALRAIVQSVGHEIVLVESTDTRCRMQGRRRGTDTWQTVTWTIDRAKGMGLTGKENWRKQPAAMLIARATGEIARLIAADAILGIGYTVEELTDGVTTTPPPAGALVEPDAAAAPVDPPTGTRRMSRATRTRPTPEPPAPATPAVVVEPDEPAAVAEPDDDGVDRMVSAAQLKKIGAGMREIGITARDDALAYVAKVIGHDVTSRNELTLAEAHQVIESLEFDTQAHTDSDPDADPWASTDAPAAP
jgi:hypothetical protein